MALGDKRIDPKTGEPEIEIAGGAWVTDWGALLTTLDKGESFHFSSGATDYEVEKKWDGKTLKDSLKFDGATAVGVPLTITDNTYNNHRFLMTGSMTLTVNEASWRKGSRFEVSADENVLGANIDFIGFNAVEIEGENKQTSVADPYNFVIEQGKKYDVVFFEDLTGKKVLITPNGSSSSAQGLRQPPVTNITALQAVVAADGMHQTVLSDDTGNRAEYVFHKGGIVTGSRVASGAGEAGAWIKDETVTGDAIERIVYQRDRGSTMTFGDLQFRVPSSGSSSLQFRVGSGSITIAKFITHWSHQQGGASEEGISFALGTSWRYFRTQGLTLTQHNNYQEAMFECNGWLYHVEVIVGGSWQNNRFSFTRWRLDAVKGDAGTNGTDAASIDHISKTAGDSSPGTTDTYTLWGDAGETVSLGTYDVPIPSAQGIQTVLLGSYDGAHSGSRTFTLAGGRTWQDVLDEFQFVYVLVGANNLFSHDQSRQWHVDDLAVQSIDMAITDYQTHGSNSYHFKMRCPASGSTTVTIDNDGSSMSVQRIRIRGVK